MVGNYFKCRQSKLIKRDLYKKKKGPNKIYPDVTVRNISNDWYSIIETGMEDQMLAKRKLG